MRSHEIDYEIFGDDMQVVEIELDPSETVIAEAGAMNWMDDGIDYESKMGDGSEPEKGQLMTFMAPSNNGKSTIMGDMCRKMFAKGYNVLYFAFEETEADFMLRIGRGLLKKTQYEYQNYNIDQLRDKWSGASEKLGRLTVVTGVAVSAESIEEVIKENEETHNCVYDAVFIDCVIQCLTTEMHQVERGQVARRVIEEHVLATRIRGVDHIRVETRMPVIDLVHEMDARIT